LAEGSAEYSVKAKLLRCVLLSDVGEVGSCVCVPFDTPFSAIVTEFALRMLLRRGTWPDCDVCGNVLCEVMTRNAHQFEHWESDPCPCPRIKLQSLNLHRARDDEVD
jgi:hypothetical protein